MIDVSKAAKNKLHGCRSSKFVPRLTPNQALGELPVANNPVALKEVKIFRASRTQVEHINGSTKQIHGTPCHPGALFAPTGATGSAGYMNETQSAGMQLNVGFP
jgi:hypothetical protein